MVSRSKKRRKAQKPRAKSHSPSGKARRPTTTAADAERGGRAPEARRISRRVLIILVAVLAVGGLLRGLYIAELRETPDFTEPFSDAGYHDYWARGIAFGIWTPPPNMADPEIDTSPYLRPPGYPFFLALVYRVTGGSYLAPRVVQALLGLLSAWLAFLIGRRWFGDAAGLIAAFLMSTHWAFIYFEGELHAPPMLIPLLLGFTLLVAGWVRGPGLLRGIAAGLLLGAAVITRPNVLLFLPAVVLWAYWLHRRDRRRHLGRAVAALVAGTLLVMVPVTIRNVAASGEFVPITSNTGVNLYMGNNPEANGLCDGDLPGIGEFGTCFDYPAVVASLEAETGRSLTDAEASNIMAGRAIDYVVENPGEALRLVGRKALLFWGPWEVTHNKVVELERKVSAVLSAIPFGFPLLAALGLLGSAMVLAEVRRRPRGSTGNASNADGQRADDTRDAVQGYAEPRRAPEAASDGPTTVHPGTREVGVLVLGLLGAWFVSILPFFAAARYRVPAIPFLALLGSAAVWWLIGRARSRAWRDLIVWVVVLATLLTLASIRFVPYRADPARWHYNRAMSYAAAGEISSALPEYRAALRIDPTNWQAHLDLGVALARLGSIQEAGPHIMEALRLNPSNPYVQYNAALIMEAVGELGRAEHHLLEVLRLAPDFPGARQDLTRIRAAIEASGGEQR